MKAERGDGVEGIRVDQAVLDFKAPGSEWIRSDDGRVKRARQVFDDRHRGARLWNDAEFEAYTLGQRTSGGDQHQGCGVENRKYDCFGLHNELSSVADTVWPLMLQPLKAPPGNDSVPLQTSAKP